ncbi:acyltransferase family protein [Spirosoma sp. HMF4905]|uniref:Acyltransferase family protein n=1 Tax=Spirosoma arboris TaxID=2682092 RepID=A0A7K1SET2_9BACT|nr:acyltransferase [Spirosoma arboris]MVM32228.1 acyltransferase family protein [Spirosoma arboris]
MNQRNGGIDVFRFLGACLVFLCHSIYSEYLPTLNLLGLLGRWVVPFFFLVSGYYFQKSYATRPVQAFTKTAKNLLFVTLFVNLFYLLFAILTEETIQPLISYFTLLTGTYFHLWFLTSMVLGYAVLWFLLRNKLDRLLPYAIVGSLLVVLVFMPYNYLLGLKPHPIYARSLLSIPFLCIGFLISKHALEGKVSKLIAYLLIGVGIVIQLGEVRFLSSIMPDAARINFLVGTLPLSVGIFLLSLRLSISPDHWLSYYGRRYSFPLYLYHPVVNLGLQRIFDKTMVMGEFMYWISPLVGLGVCIMLLVGLDKFTPAIFRALCGDFSRPRYKVEEKSA